MSEIRQEAICGSVIERQGRIRKRMMIEALSGVLVTEKDLFLQVCQMYEQKSGTDDCVVEGHERQVEHTLKEQWALFKANWGDWTDWQNFIPVKDKNV